MIILDVTIRALSSRVECWSFKEPRGADMKSVFGVVLGVATVTTIVAISLCVPVAIGIATLNQMEEDTRRYYA